jgi:cell division protease FtsH
MIAAQTPGMVGADLENLINEAAILAARRDKRSISMDELVESIERVMAGPARRSRVLDANDRRVVAYNEAGRALVIEALTHTDRVAKLTIISRGQSLGYVMSLPEEEKRLRSRAEYEDAIAALLAGRAAEEIVFAEPTTKAAEDLERVSKLAKAMVTRFGMSELLGPMQLQQGDSNPFMGMEIGAQRSYSEDVARKIDQEVRRIVNSAYDRAKTILTQQRDKLTRVAEALLEREVLDRQDFLKLLDGPAPAGA